SILQCHADTHSARPHHERPVLRWTAKSQRTIGAIQPAAALGGIVKLIAKGVLVAGALIAGALVVVTTGALADDYPSRTVRIVVPYAAGGPSDTGTRLAAEPLSQVLGKPVVVENRGGGGGLNATGAYFKAEADGCSILVGSIGPLPVIAAFEAVGSVVAEDGAAVF